MLSYSLICFFLISLACPTSITALLNDFILRTPDSQFNNLAEVGYPWAPKYTVYRPDGFPALRLHYIDEGKKLLNTWLITTLCKSLWMITINSCKHSNHYISILKYIIPKLRLADNISSIVKHLPRSNSSWKNIAPVLEPSCLLLSKA